jgi:translation initiation factor 2 alpha subunit (eIF-2alpha)
MWEYQHENNTLYMSEEILQILSSLYQTPNYEVTNTDKNKTTTKLLSGKVVRKLYRSINKHGCHRQFLF